MKYVLLITLSLFINPMVNAYSASPEKKGLEIATDLDSEQAGFIDQQADMKMILKDQRGRESIRDINVRTLEVSGDGDKTLLVFNSPKTVKGTKFLTFSHKLQDDDQWLYLPKLKRVKRISSSNKSGAFMGSEFAYEDISSEEVEKYTYKYIKDEIIDGADCYVIERTPTSNSSGYTKQIVWVQKGKGELRALRIYYFDKKNMHFKTLNFSGYKKYLDKHWRPNKMSMVNHLNKKSTDLIWSNYKFKTGLNSSDFNSNSLKR